MLKKSSSVIQVFDPSQNLLLYGHKLCLVNNILPSLKSKVNQLYQACQIKGISYSP